MTDNYNAELIELLNEKISYLTLKNDEKRREINRLKKRIKELEMLVNMWIKVAGEEAPKQWNKEYYPA